MSNSNLLILGAGQYGRFVREIAEAIGIYDKIDFLDDNSSLAIAEICKLDSLSDQYSFAIAALGDSDLRLEFTERLIGAGYTVPVVVSPLAFVSPSAELGAGTVVEPMAVIQSGVKVGKSCLVCSGAVVKHNACLEDGCYVDSNSVVAPNEIIPTKIKISVL